MEWLLVYLIVANLVSFAMFGIDKSRAKRGSRRISERALLVSAGISGTLGARLGMQTFRHKTLKRSFRTAMLGVTVLDMAVTVVVVITR